MISFILFLHFCHPLPIRHAFRSSLPAQTFRCENGQFPTHSHFYLLRPINARVRCANFRLLKTTTKLAGHTKCTVLFCNVCYCGWIKFRRFCIHLGYSHCKIKEESILKTRAKTWVTWCSKIVDIK